MSSRTTYQVLHVIDSKSVPEPNTGCTLWMGLVCSGGYGKIRFDKNHWKVHRLVYHLKVEKIKKGQLICHKCDTPACINPDHLFLGDPLVNMQDKVRKGRLKNQNMDKSHCKYGHEFTPENIRWDKTKIGTPRRTCVTCYTARYHMANAIKFLNRRKQQIKKAA